MLETLPNPGQKKIMIIAAEASSAHYALKLMRAWESKNHYFFGVGTEAMEKLGFCRIGKAEEMAIVGLVEVIKHFSFLRQVFDELVETAIQLKPEVIILMDYPDFNLRLAKKLHGRGFKIFYYISPQVWAWRKGRINDIKKYCEKVFLIFPFEKTFYDQHRVPSMFVGHPLLEDLRPEYYDQEKIRYDRQRYGVTAQECLLALMPGSRHGEIEKNLPTQLSTAQHLLKKHKQLRIMICVAPTLEKDFVRSYLDEVKFPFLLIKDDPNKMIALADLVLVASGTATLMVGLLEKPMVIMYKVSWLTGVIGGWLVRGVQFIGLINLVLNKLVVPERVQSGATPAILAGLLEKYIVDENFRHETITELKKARIALGFSEDEQKTTTQKVVEALDAYL